MKIFGYEWEDIKSAQQCGNLRDICPKMSGKEHAIIVMRDVEKFGVPVHDDVKNQYGLELPQGYAMGSDSIWRLSPPATA